MGGAEALVALLLAGPALRAQSADTLPDPFPSRLTLEHLLNFDATDPVFSPNLVDRDPVEDEEPDEGDVLPLPRSRLILGSGAERGEGETSTWTGSPLRGLIRMDLRCAPGVALGLTYEKDAGERPDLGFFSGYLALGGLPLKGEAILGDYRLHAGCGLVAGGAASPVRMEETLRRAGKFAELAPHRSRDEFSFLRGLAVRFSPAHSGWLRCLLFSSRRTLAASGDEDAPSLSTNALFRTAGEIRRRGEISETVFGGRVVARTGHVSAGLTLLHTWFTPPLARGGGGTPEGSSAMIVGLDFSTQPAPFMLSGEIARSPGGGVGAVLLGSLRVGRSAFVAAGFQALSPAFANYRSAGVVTSSASNDVSLRILARYDLSPASHLRGSLAQHWTPSIPASRNSPSAGWSGSIGGSLGLSSRWRLEWFLHFRRGDDELSFVSAEGGEKHWVLTGRSSARVSLCGRAGGVESLTICERARSCDGSGGEEYGEQLREEFAWNPAAWLGISLTATLYSSDSYAARTTSLEDDAISRMRFVSLDGEGFRWGSAVRLKPPLRGVTILLLLSGDARSRCASTLQAWGVRTSWTW